MTVAKKSLGEILVSLLGVKSNPRIKACELIRMKLDAALLILFIEATDGYENKATTFHVFRNKLGLTLEEFPDQRGYDILNYWKSHRDGGHKSDKEKQI